MYRYDQPADPQCWRHGRAHHGHSVDDAVLAVAVLHGTHHAGHALSHGAHQQRPITQHLGRCMLSQVHNIYQTNPAVLIRIRLDILCFNTVNQ